MKSAYLNSKKAHKDAVVSTASFKDSNGRKSPDLILSAGDDGLIKLWDLRVDKAVKLFRHTGSKSDSYSNLQVDSINNRVYIAADNRLISYDIKTDKLVIDSSSIEPISHDFINNIDLKDSHMAYVDDEYIK